MEESDKVEIDDLVSAFYSIFDNRNSRSPNMSMADGIFTPSATITKRTPAGMETWNVSEFMSPRVLILTNGTLENFHEWEIEAETLLSNNIAARLSRFRKDGILNGAPYRGEGTKLMQLCRMGNSWMISSILWEEL